MEFDDTANAGTVGFPDELGADLLKNQKTATMATYNNTIDLDEDYDAIYDWNDVDDDNDESGISSRLIQTDIWTMTQTKTMARTSSQV